MVVIIVIIVGLLTIPWLIAIIAAILSFIGLGISIYIILKNELR